MPATRNSNVWDELAKKHWLLRKKGNTTRATSNQTSALAVREAIFYMAIYIMKVGKANVRIVVMELSTTQNQSNAWDAWRWRTSMWLVIHNGALSLGYHCIRT